MYLLKTTTLQRLNVLAAHHQLGEPLAFVSASPKPLSRLGLLATLVGLVLLIVLALLASLLIALLPWWQVVLVLSIALCWIGIGLWLQAASLMSRRSIETLLCTNGIVWKHRRSVEAIRWQDIESLWRKTTYDSARRYEIRLRDGRVVVLDSHVHGAEKLARFVERVVTSRHVASLMRAYQSGATFKFGPLCISQRGLQVPQHPEALAWDQIKYVRPIKGVLTIQQKGHAEHWATIALSTVPNVCLAETLVQRIYALHQTQARNAFLERSA